MAAKTSTQEFGYRLGRGAKRVAQGYLRYEQQAAAWLSTQGVPVVLTTALLWSIKLALLGVLLYAAFLVAALTAVIVGWAYFADGQEEDTPEWREGHSGFGLYDKSEWRIDMPGPDEV